MSSSDQGGRSTLSATHPLRTSRSLQYDQQHTQFSDPTTVSQTWDPYDSTSSWSNAIMANGSSFEFGAEFEGADGGSTAVADSLIVICTLFVPLAIAISAILIIALLIRRMRRAESMQDMDDEEKCTNSQQSNSHYYSQQISTEDIPNSVIVRQQQLAPSFLLNNKKSIPLPVILGLVEPDDVCPTLESHTSVVMQDECSNQHRRGSTTSVSSTNANGRPRTQSIPCNSNYHNNVVDGSNNSIHKMSSSNHSLNFPSNIEGGAGVSPSKSSFSDRVLNVLQFPKRMKEQQAEKKRFNIYTVSVETREQLKQIYVY